MANHLVIIPTYNERINIARMIGTVLSLDEGYELLVVDDNSPDGTGQEVKSQMQKYTGRLHLLERPGKSGLGRAYIAGFKWALERDYATITEMDADFSHNPNDLPRLLEACMNGADVSVGSRYVKNGQVKNWPTNRVLISKYASVYVRIITGMSIRDTTAGFVCYKREVLKAINLEKINFVGYAFQIEMKFASTRLGFVVVEVPITFVDRIEGDSKMSKGIFKEAVFGVISMKFRSFFHSYAHQ